MRTILIPSLSRISSAGGGTTFIKNFVKALKPFGYTFVEKGDHDIFFIAGATLCEREQFNQSNAPKVLRVDNILEDRKNRGTGMPRLEDFAKESVIVYQSDWAKRLLTPICGDGIVVRNGCDGSIFYPRKNEKAWENIRVLYSKFSRNETKNFHECQYFWRDYNIDKEGDELWLVGRYADDLRQSNHPFEFHNGEHFEYKGALQTQEQMATLLREVDVAFLPYYGDACPNTVIEAQMSGIPVIFHSYGGTREVVGCGVHLDYEQYSPQDMINLALTNSENFDWKEYRQDRGLEAMGEKYHSLFTLLLNKEHDVEL